MTRRLDRLVVKTVLVLTALAGFAFMHNQQANPCTGHQMGAGGMCVSTTWAGGIR